MPLTQSLHKQQRSWHCAKDCRGARLGLCHRAEVLHDPRNWSLMEKLRRMSPRLDPAEMVPDKSPPLATGRPRRRGRELIEGGRGGALRDGEGHRLGCRRPRQVDGGVEEAETGMHDKTPPSMVRRRRKSSLRDPSKRRKTLPPPSLPLCGLSRQTAPAAAGWTSGGRGFAPCGCRTPPEPPQWH